MRAMLALLTSMFVAIIAIATATELPSGDQSGCVACLGSGPLPPVCPIGAPVAAWRSVGPPSLATRSLLPSGEYVPQPIGIDVAGIFGASVDKSTVCRISPPYPSAIAVPLRDTAWQPT